LAKLKGASHPELLRYLLCGHAQSFGKGRKGELNPRELLDPHAGRHAHGRDLDDLGRVFAEHVSAEHAVTLPVDDELAESLRARINHGTRDLIVAHQGDHAVMARAALYFGETNTAVLRIRKAASRNDGERDSLSVPQQGVLGSDPAFVARAR